jgi:cell division protein FtsB
LNAAARGFVVVRHVVVLSSFLSVGAPLSGVKSMHRLLPIFVAGFTIASALTYFFGDSGLLAYRRLDGYRQALTANVQALKARNTELTKELASLRENPQRSLVLAREIGFSQPGDEVVKLEGVADPGIPNEVGALLKMRKSKASRNVIFKATGMGISVILAAFAVVAGRASRRKRSSN